MTYSRHHTIDHYLKKVRIHTEPYTAEIAGKEIIILPGVMSPKYDRSAQMIISMMPSQNGKDVLEIGSGTGILALCALLQGAQRVVATDINPIAIKNTQQNFDRYNFTNCTVALSDLFEKVEGVFDTIIFNAPFHGNEALDTLELGTSDFNYKTLTAFLGSAGKFLKPDGEILLGFADTGDNELLKSLIAKNSFVIKNFQTYPNGDWTMYLYTLNSRSSLIL